MSAGKSKYDPRAVLFIVCYGASNCLVIAGNAEDEHNELFLFEHKDVNGGEDLEDFSEVLYEMIVDYYKKNLNRKPCLLKASGDMIWYGYDGDELPCEFKIENVKIEPVWVFEHGLSGRLKK